MNLFEKALKGKYRFETTKGLAQTEDLFDLSVTQLDKIYIELRKQIKDSDNESLLNPKPTNVVLSDKIEIVKYVVGLKQAEIAEKELATQKSQMKQKLLAEKARRDENKFTHMSDEELDKMLNEVK